MTIETPLLIGYPPAPSNGGPLEHAPAKVGAWRWQPKVDDWRGIQHTPTRRVWNQYGEPSAVEERGQIATALDAFEGLLYDYRHNEPDVGFEWFDIGIMRNRHDMMRGCIIVLDVMDTKLTHDERRAVLEQMFPSLPVGTNLKGVQEGEVYLIAQAFNGCEPLALQNELKRSNAQLERKFYEGTVAKRADALYPLQHRAKAKTSLWIKHRFDQ
jgi:hypothetical protein